MIQTTQEWKDYSIDHSNYHPLIVVIKNGNIIWTFDATNIKEGSLKFTDDITDLGDFNIGATPSNSFECDIINFDDTFPSPSTFRGCKANLYFFLEQPEFGGSNAVVGQAIVGQAIVGTESTWTDYIKRGVYYLDPVDSVGRTVHISGYDAMSLAEFNSANMSGFSFSGLTCYQAIKKMGFNLQHDFPMSDYVLPNVVCNEESNLANITKRTALGYIASLCGCYARHDNTGELKVEPFALYNYTPPTIRDSTITSKNGLTFKVNADASVTVNGTASANVQWFWKQRTDSNWYLPKGNYTFTGCPSGGGSASWSIRINETLNDSGHGLAYDYGNGRTFVVDDTNVDCPKGMYIEIKSGTVINNLVFKPFLIKDVTPTAITKIMQEPILDYYPVVNTGVFVSGTEGSYSVKGSDGYYMFVENNPLITSPSIADEIATTLLTAYNGLSIYPFSLSYIADPSLQAGDTIDITYNGNTTTTIVGSFQYSLGNQSSLSIDADVEEHSSAEALIASIPGTKLAIQDLYKGDVLKKIINLSADEVQIDAQQMNINGVVSANGNFRVLTDGTIEAVNGKFSGQVNASSGTFSGSVNFASGQIGGFTVGNNNIYNGMTSIDSTANGVYVGTDGFACGGGDFKINASGNGKIGEWNFGIEPNSDTECIYSDPYDTGVGGCMGKAIISNNVDDVVIIDPDTQASITLPASAFAVDIQPLKLDGNPANYYKREFWVDKEAKVHAPQFVTTSDRREKDHIKPLTDPITLKLKPVTFVMRNDPTRTHHGFIAQDVEEVCKDMVVDGETKGLMYTEIIADLVATVQSLNKRIEELEKNNGIK